MHRFGDDEDFEDEFESFDDDALDSEKESFDDEQPEVEESDERTLARNGDERCPICGKRGSPTNGDACEHFQAVVFDDDVIVGGDEVMPAWEELDNLWREYDDLFLDQFADELEESLARAPAGVQQVVRDGLMDESPLFWTEGAQTVMRERAGRAGTSGNGYTVYHRDSGYLARIASDMCRAHRWLQKFASSRLEDE